MYGLVNMAIERQVIENFGKEAWDKIKEQADLKIESFSKMESYPDEVTYNLVAAAVDVLNVPAGDILEAFGEYWTVYVAKEGYGDLMKMGGQSVKDFCLNLNNLHTRVGMSFPNLQPPDFKCLNVEEDSLTLQYFSERPGLAPMVLGLIKGLGKLFNEDVGIELVKSRDEGHVCDEFSVRYKAA